MNLNGKCTFEVKETISNKSGRAYTHIVFKIGDYELKSDSKGAPFFLTSDQLYIIAQNAKKTV